MCKLDSYAALKDRRVSSKIFDNYLNINANISRLDLLGSCVATLHKKAVANGMRSHLHS